MLRVLLVLLYWILTTAQWSTSLTSLRVSECIDVGVINESPSEAVFCWRLVMIVPIFLRQLNCRVSTCPCQCAEDGSSKVDPYAFIVACSYCWPQSSHWIHGSSRGLSSPSHRKSKRTKGEILFPRFMCFRICLWGISQCSSIVVTNWLSLLRFKMILF